VLTEAQNELLTRSGPGTAMGRVLRRYWQALALVAELPDERPLKHVRVMGEDIVVFRDDKGRYGALARRCAHRAGDLSYGRLEDGGLRCPYHGWLYDVGGRCLEQPAEPPGSLFHEKVRQPSYPCIERNGIVWGYLGPGEAPPLPAFDWHLAPASHTFVWKGLQRANWLQANEGEIDPSHLSYLHRYLTDEIDRDASYGFDQFLAAAEGTGVSVTKLLREIPNPRLEIERTDFGVRIFALRDAQKFMHVRVTNFVFPNAALVAIGDWNLVQLHVPIDDVSNWRYDIFYSFNAPMDSATLLRERLNTYTVPDYVPKRNMENRYLFSAEEQKTGTYAGVGYDFNIHDTCILEGQGPVQDRTKEHLAYTDKAIIAARQMLMEAAASSDGDALPAMPRGARDNTFDDLATIDTITEPDDWRRGWIARQLDRRQASTWARGIEARKLAAGLKADA
jgi:nitrite reductase/ring-hydroxylating ferredoxin subunit